tara:strand:+ start:200 stop:655 length:456 start_codon:yes stop_codon:yes gene_type:complete
MDKKYGLIEKVSTSTGTGRNGVWTRYEFLMADGKKYSTFDEAIGKGFVIGNYVEMSGKQDGQYWKMLTMMEIDEKVGTQVPTIPDAKELKPTNKLMSSRDELIVAQVLMKGAIEMSKGHNFENSQDEAKYMCECIPELHGVLKVALNQLNE